MGNAEWEAEKLIRLRQGYGRDRKAEIGNAERENAECGTRGQGDRDG
jgi:hypothetical protein